MESALNVSDFQSGTWGRLIEVVQARLETAQRRLEGPQAETDTNVMRGRIAELRFILEMEEEFHRRLDEVRLHDKPDYSLT